MSNFLASSFLLTGIYHFSYLLFLHFFGPLFCILFQELVEACYITHHICYSFFIFTFIFVTNFSSFFFFPYPRTRLENRREVWYFAARVFIFSLLLCSFSCRTSPVLPCWLIPSLEKYSVAFQSFVPAATPLLKACVIRDTFLLVLLPWQIFLALFD